LPAGFCVIVLVKKQLKVGLALFLSCSSAVGSGMFRSMLEAGKAESLTRIAAGDDARL
jgi:hypothetical protein